MAVQVTQRFQRPLPALRRSSAAPLIWSLLATALLVLLAFGQGVPLSDWLGDPDDAVRLVTVRELIAGAPWFDTTLPRIGAPDPLVSHWSRLIDLPLAVLMRVLTPLLGVETAELATRIIWPVLLFFGLSLAVAREAERRGGSWAGAFALLLAATSTAALVQFLPGRIDHHNAQILCAVAGLLMLMRSLEDKRAGWAAGLLLGLGLAIGYEAIALVVPALGLAVLVALWRPALGAGVARTAVAATSVLFAAFVLTVAPSRWLDVHCDALSLNLPVLAACCSAGLWAALAVGMSPAARFAIAGASAAIGLGLFSALEPVCLAGPFGQVTPALGPAWLDNVMEAKSALWLAARYPAATLAFIAFVTAGTAAQVATWRARPNASTGLAAAIAVLAALLGCWQIKLMPYASWLAAVPLAVFASSLHARASISAPVMRLAAVLLLSQATLEVVFSALPWRSDTAEATGPLTDPQGPCFRSANVRRLAELPPASSPPISSLGPTSSRCRRTASWLPPTIGWRSRSLPIARSSAGRLPRRCGSCRNWASTTSRSVRMAQPMACTRRCPSNRDCAPGCSAAPGSISCVSCHGAPTPRSGFGASRRGNRAVRSRRPTPPPACRACRHDGWRRWCRPARRLLGPCLRQCAPAAPRRRSARAASAPPASARRSRP